MLNFLRTALNALRPGRMVNAELDCGSVPAVGAGRSKSVLAMPGRHGFEAHGPSVGFFRRREEAQTTSAGQIAILRPNLAT